MTISVLLLAAGILSAPWAAPARTEPAATVRAPLPALAPPPAEASGVTGSLDVEAATRAYLGELSGPARARSDAYFEGGYWLMLWNFLSGAFIALLLLFTGYSARMRDRAERITRRAYWRSAAYAAQYLVAVAVLSFPLELYQGYFREHAYGLSHLTLGGWLGEWAKGLSLDVVLLAPALAVLYAIVRRVPRTWWLWGGVAAAAFVLFTIVLAPVVIVPVFNHPTRLTDERVTAAVLSLARANGLATDDVWEVDASKQTSRISANVSGALGTARITLNDNLLARCSLPEIRAVMGHELGHYLMGHQYLVAFALGVLALIGLAVVHALFQRIRDRFPGWGVRSIDDPAGLPLVALLFSAYVLVATPLTNSLTRSIEQQADSFGLNAAGEPDGFARAALRLAEYRKLEPTPLEEFVFYDHPSGRTRIRAAMRWKAEHPETWAPPAQPGREGGSR
ncbi:MAG TPA: M48 family metallopeptidase [Anaeromyxobacter sp.]|nr:M48 family metallopeptidase [Anaeromyxobacter sp.]